MIDAAPPNAAAVEAVLGRFGPGPRAVAERAGVRIAVLGAGERFGDRSPVLRRIVAGVDAWPIPPAGLFVVEERTVYLRSASPMTIAHEFAHGLDCALGGGVYRSGYDPGIRSAFEAARCFVTPYAATGLDEYFAECVRAYVEVNDRRSPWPRATRARLLEIDRTMSGVIERIFGTDFRAAPL